MTRIAITGITTLDIVCDVDTIPHEPVKHVANDADITIGGCAANAAIAVTRLGARALLASRLGDDVIADLITRALQTQQIDTSCLHYNPGGRSSFSTVARDTHGERLILNFRGEGLTSDTGWLTTWPEVDAVLADNRWPPAADTAMQLARARGVPGIIDGEGEISPATLQCASHVAFSAEGLRLMAGQQDLRSALAALATATSAWLCVTDGANGIWYRANNRIEHLPAFDIRPVDTLGAGDVWHGAFAVRLSEGADERDAMVFANAAAALKCTRVGVSAVPDPDGQSAGGAPDRAEVQAFLDART